MVRTSDKPWLDDRCVLAHCAKQRVYQVWGRTRTQANWEEQRVACRHGQIVYVDAERAFTERSN